MKNKILISIVLVVAIILLANLISQDFFVRLDFSEDKQYTLNDATKNLLKDLKEPVTIKAYFTEELPPAVAKVKKDFKEMLIEYNNRSKGMLVYEFVNPSAKEDKEAEAQQEGIQPVMIDIREKDQIKQQKVYLGAVVSMGERKEVIPIIQPGAALEYSLSKAIKKLSIAEKPSIGLLQGHGEPPIQEIVQVYNELSVMYNVEPLTLNDSASIPDRIKSVLIIRPKDTIPSSHLSQLDNFLSRGGHILVAASRVNADTKTLSATAFSTGIENWLKTKGIVLNDNVVVDASCNTIQVVQQQANFQMVSNMQFFYFPNVKNFAKHEIGSGLESVAMPFTSSIEFTGSSNIKFSPIAYSSEKSGVEQLPLYLNLQRQWTDADFPRKNIVMAAAFSGKLVGNTDSKIVVIGCGDFIVNGQQGQQQQRFAPDNISLLVNSVDWLSDDTGLIGLRTKAVTSRPIDELADGTKTTLKWVNFLLPILLIIGYGFFRAQVKRNLRIKRMEENYV